jgi:DNA recombination protein RmuC
MSDVLPASWPFLLLGLLAALNLLLLAWLVLRGRDTRALDRLEAALRDELGRQSQALRGDLGNFQRMLLAQSGDVARTQNEQIDAFRVQLASTQTTLTQQAQALQSALARQSDAAREAQDAALRRLGDAMEQRLERLQQGNEAKLEQMRATVDEKLHATLEARLGESFRQVAERLEQVHRGLGEMQTLARDVGALNRVLTNVKTRGVFGEVQLAGLLEQVFTPEQYARNVATLPGSREVVEFAIRLPGQRADGAPLWLPIDAKFPREDYERLLEAHERADAAGVESAAKAIESRLRQEAKSIREKYVGPPHTTDFAILFLPTEGLYAEALRRPGLLEALQREHKVMLAGPTTLLATLNSLQMGFRTLALEQRSAEVWEVLGAVKTEFGRFGEVLAKTKKKLDEASHTIDAAEQRARVMARQLRGVEALPEARAAELLPPAAVVDPSGVR